MRRFFIEEGACRRHAPATCSISGSEANHIKNVLRLKPGDKVVLFDGSGNEYEAEILCLKSDSVELSVIRSLTSRSESPLRITAAQGFLKDKKMDDLIRHLTELGISGWLPVIAGRSVSHPDSKSLDVRVERWKKIATEALKQCRRSRIPDIYPAVSFKEAVDIGKAYDSKIIFWENEISPLEPSLGDHTSERPCETIFILLGPEGGFTPDEVRSALESGFIAASLGPRILRSETAAIAACTLLQYFFGDMGKKS